MFTIEHQRHGTLMHKFIVPEKNGEPLNQLIGFMLDSRLHTALNRCQWEQHPLMSDVMVKHLVGSKGQPLGTLIAKRTQ